jgi:hypothetical protein
MKIMTFEEWSKAGYRVIKGEKAVGRRKSDGKPVFAERQVWRPADETPLDDYENDMAFGGDPWGLDS